MNRIYLDYAATTPLDPRVMAAMQKTETEAYGNPNSIHHEGQHARAQIDEARRSVAEIFDRQEQEVIFTPSATTANNLVIQGIIKRFKKLYPTEKPEIIISPLEHASVYETAHVLEREGELRVHILAVDNSGQIIINDVQEKISKNTALVSVQWVNNETGIIQPIKKIMECVHRYREENQSPYPFFHTDAVQGIGHLATNDVVNVDYITTSAHKIYGPKGIGVLILPQNSLLDPIIYGGGQENGWWSGTEASDRIVGCGVALSYAARDYVKNYETFTALQAYIVQKLHQSVARERMVVRTWKPTSPHILSVQLVGTVRPDIALDQAGVAVSSGAACAQQNITPSRILIALGLSEQEARESIRISLGRQTTKHEIDMCVIAIENLLDH